MESIKVWLVCPIHLLSTFLSRISVDQMSSKLIWRTSEPVFGDKCLKFFEKNVGRNGDGKRRSESYKAEEKFERSFERTVADRNQNFGVGQYQLDIQIKCCIKF